MCVCTCKHVCAQVHMCMCVWRCHPQQHVISPFLTHSACPCPPIPEVGGPRRPSATARSEGRARPCSPRRLRPPAPLSRDLAHRVPERSRAGLSVCTAARARGLRSAQHRPSHEQRARGGRRPGPGLARDTERMQGPLACFSSLRVGTDDLHVPSSSRIRRLCHAYNRSDHMRVRACACMCGMHTCREW